MDNANFARSTSELGQVEPVVDQSCAQIGQAMSSLSLDCAVNAHQARRRRTRGPAAQWRQSGRAVVGMRSGMARDVCVIGLVLVL